MATFLASRFVTDVFQGLANGIIYALIALSLVIIWQSTHILNFAQGAMGMLATYIGLSEIGRGLNYWLCVAISVVIGFIFGGLTERVLVRPLYGKPEINPIVVMVGFLAVIEAVAAAIWNTTPRTIPTPYSQIYYHLDGRLIWLSPWVVFQIAAAVVIMLGMAMLFRITKIGLQLRASAVAPEVSRLLGVRVNRMLTTGWMLASAVGAVAAVMVSSNFNSLSPTNMDIWFISGFIAAAIGGLESPVGAVIGGLGLGIANQLIFDYWSGNVSPATGLMLMVVVLMIRPQGVFSKKTSRRV